jgi:prepilin-type N-terminal cleavage/methylation domain-containing protein
MARTELGREQGFTLIELLIVSIIVGILATLVAMTYSGVQAKNRNADRQTEIQKVQSQLETYYAQHNTYPSLNQLNDVNWRKNNLPKLSSGVISDPQWKVDNIKCSTRNGQPALASSPSSKCYSYQATTADGSGCTDQQVICAQYTLTAIFEAGEKYVKSSLN